MIIFPINEYWRTFVNEMPRAKGGEPGQFAFLRYPNGEPHILIESRVKNQDCLIVGALSPDTDLINVLLLADALQRNGARQITALLPYLAYSRQDKPQPGTGSGTELIGALLKTAGVNKIITLDIHSSLDPKLLGVPTQSISSVPLFQPILSQLGDSDFTLVAPDEGARSRVSALANKAGIVSIAYLKKYRQNDTPIHQEIVGEIGPRVVIYDDILDTGHTLVSACKLLRAAGAKEIIILVTHGLFMGQDWEQLFNLGVKAIYTTNTIPGNDNRLANFDVKFLPAQQLID